MTIKNGAAAAAAAAGAARCFNLAGSSGSGGNTPARTAAITATALTVAAFLVMIAQHSGLHIAGSASQFLTTAALSKGLLGSGGRRSGVPATEAAWRELPRPNHAAAVAMSKLDPPALNPAPSLNAFERLQADPGAVAADPSFYIAEFEAAPWLLPPRTPVLPWAGVHDFDQLLTLRSRPAGRHERAVALLLFSRAYALLAQNSIYSLVKMGGVQNHIVLTWTPDDLAACADLNLPCADVSHMLTAPMQPENGTEGVGGWGTHNWLDAVWLKPAVMLHTLRLGYATMLADVDIAYTTKPLWDSYLAFIDQAQADGAFQHEDPVNTGQFVMLPTPAALAFAERWLGQAPAMIARGLGEQPALRETHHTHFHASFSLCECLRSHYNLTAAGLRANIPVFRTFFPGYFLYTATCTVGSPDWIGRLDPRDWTLLFLHPICMKLTAGKQASMHAAGFWFIDSEQGCAPQTGAVSGVPACRPLRWRLPQTEAPHYACPLGTLGLVHGGEPAALAVLRQGADAATLARLMDDPLNAALPALWCKA